MTPEVVQVQIQSIKESVDNLRTDLKDNNEQAHAMVIGVHQRLDTFAGTMQQIEDVRSSNARIAAELIVIKKALEPVPVMRSKVELHSKVLGFIAMGIGGGLITAILSLILIKGG